jgi:hypothetical protein
MKVYETLEQDLQHPEHPEVVITIRKPDVITRTELMEAMLFCSDPEKVKADLRRGLALMVAALAKVISNITGLEGMRGLEGVSYADAPERYLSALIIGPQPLMFPGPEVDGKPSRVPMSNVIAEKMADDAFFGLDPEGKASPAPQIDS